VGSVAFSPDGSTLAAACDDHVVRVLRVDGSAPPSELRGHADVVRAVAFSPDGKTIVSGSHDKSIVLWPVDGASRPRVLTDAGYVTSVAVSADGHFVASGSAEWPDDEAGNVRIWDLRASNAEPAAVMKAHHARVSSVAFAPGGALVASASEDGDLRLWSTSSRENLLVLRAVRGGDLGYAFTPDGYVAYFGEGARAYAMCRVGGLVFPLDLCEERVVVPDLVSRVAAGDTTFREP
jgi:WD40 repeat protein